MGHVIIGMDSHKRSATLETVDEREHVLGAGRFGTVIDVLATLSAGARVLSTGQGRKADPIDARSVTVVALRSAGLRHVRVVDIGGTDRCADKLPPCVPEGHHGRSWTGMARSTTRPDP
jgi:hypothetical protein